MFPFAHIKIQIFLALVLLFFASCRFGQKNEAETNAQTPSVAEELKSEVPFSTKEPQIFQTEIVVSANNRKRVYYVARNGMNRRFDYDFADVNQVSVLQTDKNYLLYPSKKVYAEDVGGENTSAPESWTDFLTTEWLNQRNETFYERLEPENNLAKYLIRINGSNLSESIIYVDENLGFPVKQEFYSIGGEQRVLTYSVELRNTKLQTDETTFSIPKNYRQVSIAEFRKISHDVQPK